LKHDKHDPIDLGDGIKMYADNVLLETSFPPSFTRDGFVTKLKNAFHRIQDKLGKRYSLVPQSSHIYDPDQLGPKPEIMEGELPVEWEIGCNPNYDVYGRCMRKPTPFQDGLRTGSFHIHIGNFEYTNPNETKLITVESKEQMVKLMDIFVGCSSVIFDKDETSLARRALYGKAGEFRPTKYGIEYRCLGGYPLRSPELAGLVIDLTEYAVSFIDSGQAAPLLNSVDEVTVRRAIDTNNKGLASAVLAVAGLPNNLWKKVTQDYNPNFARDWQL
jgi:hypothetical protein